MLRAVAHTHAVIWYIFADARLSKTAQTAIAQIAAAGDQVAFSSITLAEIVYLSDKGCISPLTPDQSGQKNSTSHCQHHLGRKVRRDRVLDNAFTPYLLPNMSINERFWTCSVNYRYRNALYLIK